MPSKKDGRDDNWWIVNASEDELRIAWLKLLFHRVIKFGKDL